MFSALQTSPEPFDVLNHNRVLAKDNLYGMERYDSSKHQGLLC